jgi:hypothetical protein
MQLTAWLIGDGTESILDEVTDGHPPAQVWVPLEASDVDLEPSLRRFRSAWAHRTTDGEQWSSRDQHPARTRDIAAFSAGVTHSP